MKIQLDIHNYEEIMFRLMEGDFDESTKNSLLTQIESDELFKFEWDSWQKTKFNDPIENYLYESSILTKSIIHVAEDKPEKRKILVFYLAAASVVVLLGSLFLLNTDSKPGLKQAVISGKVNHRNELKQKVPESQNTKVIKVQARMKRSQQPEHSSETLLVAIDSFALAPGNKSLAEIPIEFDTVPANTNEIAKEPDKKPRYKVIIETKQLIDINQNNNNLAQNRKGKIGQILTNPKLLFQRKPDGEPERIIILGEKNSYLCINLNYTEK